MTDVVVGVDGSAPSLAALRWAATEARYRKAALQILLAYHWRFPGARLLATHGVAEAIYEQTNQVVEEAVALARKTAPDVDVRGFAVFGHPAPVLLEAAYQAVATVVGHRGHGGFARLLLGSVAMQVAAHAPGPVVVVRGRTEPAIEPVVVGVDGSPAADVALDAAFAAASARDVGLVVARAFPDARRADATSVTPPGHDPATFLAAQRDELVAHVGRWRDRYPLVPVEHEILPGDATDVLTTLSLRAQLVVVGSRGRGGFTQLTLGSVSQQLIQHTDCPVLIARGRPGR